jgi:prophage regulatory protein
MPKAIPSTSKRVGLKILRIADVCEKTGLRTAAIYKLQAAGKFPHSVRVGDAQGGAVGWVESEIDEYLLERMSQRGTAGAAAQARG